MNRSSYWLSYTSRVIRDRQIEAREGQVKRTTSLNSESNANPRPRHKQWLLKLGVGSASLISLSGKRVDPDGTVQWSVGYLMTSSTHGEKWKNLPRSINCIRSPRQLATIFRTNKIHELDRNKCSNFFFFFVISFLNII